MVCLFCLRETNYGVSMFGESEMAENARNIISAHFWFDMNEMKSTDVYVCSNCWTKVETFHEFYLMIAKIHQISPENKDASDEKITFNSPLLSEYELTGDNESLINLDTDSLQPCASEFETIFIQNVSFLDESVKNQFEETMPATTHQLVSSNMSSSSNEETLALVLLNDGKDDKKPMNQNVIPSKKSQTWREKWYKKKKMKTNCPICGKKLAYGSLWYHIRSIHENKVPKMKGPNQFECEICGQWINGSSELVAHNLSHVDTELAQVKYYIDDKWYQELIENHKQITYTGDSTMR